MQTAHVARFETPKGVSLHGLWFGSRKAKRVVIVVHGLAGNLFSMGGVVEELAKGDQAVLTFNNRGHDIISTTKRRVGTRSVYSSGGTAHESFADCVDDIDGAIRFARAGGARDIYLAGHSTGAQKIIFWHSKTKDRRGVRGIVLLGPLSDYAETFAREPKRTKAGVALARKLVAQKRGHELMPAKYAADFELDAQRYLSLYSADSQEELFTYGQPGVVPKKLRAVELPILVLLAGEDEYGSRPPETIAEWFIEYIYSGEAEIIAGVNHGFKGGERQVAKCIDSFMKERYN